MIKEKDKFLQSLRLVEEELLYPQVKAYAENDTIKQIVNDNTEEFVEYSFIVYQLGTDNSYKGTFEAVSFLDANIRLIKILAKGFEIIHPHIVSDERYRSFVVYETNGRR